MNNSSQLTEHGYLRVNVYTDNMAFPVSNAAIRISSGEDTIYQLTTNLSGQAEIISLSAPPIEFSMNSLQIEKPYSMYDLTISATGFDTTVIHDVQILPHANAIQNVMLHHQTEDLPKTIHINIPANTLWSFSNAKIAESDVKPLPPSQGFIVLPEPVIPELIIVHDGQPTDASAQDYWIPFRDYIKNVASCEIYPTWPENTIRANVLAILSFTLNRVFTEWYRGNGYNFTITSSTAYDQAFSYGRNIFEEISRIVDEIFTNYITRPGIQQPLFTQYCDGQRVQCPNWLSQWGSKTLGDNGYSTMDILRHYYGQEIYLMQANSVEGVPSSFSGTALQMNSEGPDVRTIQTQLNAISENYPAIPKLKIDGIFDQTTLEAVELFQDIFGLESTGIVDATTWYTISKIYVAVTRMAESN